MSKKNYTTVVVYAMVINNINHQKVLDFVSDSYTDFMCPF